MLHRLWPWPRRIYPDRRLALLARLSVADDPLLADVTHVSITCVQGRIRLKGRVPQASDKARIEADIRGALRTAGLTYVGLVNALQVTQARMRPARTASLGEPASLLGA